MGLPLDVGPQRGGGRDVQGPRGYDPSGSARDRRLVWGLRDVCGGTSHSINNDYHSINNDYHSINNDTTGILRSLLRVVPPLPAAGAYVVGGHATTAAAAAAGPSVSFVGFGSGLVYALSMFGGFEGAAVLGDEVVHPTKTIPRALALTIVVSTAFYFLASLAFRVGFKDPHEWAKDAAPLITMGGRWGSPTLVNILYISILFDGWAGCLACVTTASRLIARLARAGVFPCR